MIRIRLIAVVVALAAIAGPTGAQNGPQPLNIPPGFDFPANEAALLRMRDNQDVAGMRAHAWQVFAGLTQPSPNGEAIWETWYPSNITFSSGPQPQGLSGEKMRRVFVVPRQFHVPGHASPQAVGASLTSFVMFNADSHNHIRGNSYQLRATLSTLNKTFTSATPVEQRAIKSFPPTAMSLKPVWEIVKASGLTPLHVWDNTPQNANSAGNPENTWTRSVLIDPSRTNIPADELNNKMHVVSLEKFYHFKIGAAEKAGGVPGEIGDYAVLVAMHYTTKEIPDWVWATVWWHDTPDNGSFALDRPASVAGVWRNYLMDTTFSMDTPREYDGLPNSTYNPYLEARFPNGMSSNCMTCHQMAVIDSKGNSPQFLPVTRGAKDSNDPLFRTRTKTDFLWSMPFEAQ